MSQTGGVASLDHKALDDTVEEVVVIVAVARVQAEVLGRARRVLAEETHVYVSQRRM
jgi:hypothetical protein